MKAAGAALLVAAGVALGIRFGTGGGKAPAPPTMPSPSPPAAKVALLLAYPRADLSGVSLVRAHVPDERADLTRWLQAVLAELARPPAPGIAAPLPAGMQLQTAFLDPGKTLYLDFSPDAAPPAWAGVEWETLAVKALAQTMAEAVPEARGLKILAGGNDRATLWGHVDLRQPFPIRPLSSQ